MPYFQPGISPVSGGDGSTCWVWGPWLPDLAWLRGLGWTKPWDKLIIYGYGSIPINTIFSGMNIHLPAILMFTRGTRFWHTAILVGGLEHFVFFHNILGQSSQLTFIFFKMVETTNQIYVSWDTPTIIIGYTNTYGKFVTQQVSNYVNGWVRAQGVSILYPKIAREPNVFLLARQPTE